MHPGAVAGATASGKSSVVDEIVRLLDHESVASVTQDCFYKNLSDEERQLAYDSSYNFDHPNAFDFDMTIDVLRQLRLGAHSVSVPTYDFRTHSRLPSSADRVITAPEIVIFEGILALHDERMRDLFDLKIFVDAGELRSTRTSRVALQKRFTARFPPPPLARKLRKRNERPPPRADADVRLARRIERDMKTRGRDLAGILEQYTRFVKPATESFVLPTKDYADLIVPRGVENTVAIDLIATHINEILIERSLRRELSAEAALLGERAGEPPVTVS